MGCRHGWRTDEGSHALLRMCMHSSCLALPLINAARNLQRMLQYLEMIDDVMRNGVFRGDRTGTGALCCAVMRCARLSGPARSRGFAVA